MKLDQIFKTRMGMGAFAIALLMSGCIEKQNLHNPDHGKNQLPPKGEMFDYTTRTDVKLSVNYDMPNFQAIIQIFDEDPLKENGKDIKDGLTPIFSAYTDENAKYSGNISIPIAMKEAYLYTNYWGLPTCIKLELLNNAIEYDATKQPNSRIDKQSRAVPEYGYDFTSGSRPWKLSDLRENEEDDGMYTISEWSYNGTPKDMTFINDNSVSALSQRIKDYLSAESEEKGNCKSLLRDTETTNINITEDETELKATYLHEQGAYENVFGYYYYKTNEVPALTGNANDLSKLKKYIIFPRASYGAFLKCGHTIALKYFDERGGEHDSFPKGYTVGWFLIANGFTYYETIINKNELYTEYTNQKRNIFYSNDPKKHLRFVSLNDQKTGAVAIAIEDDATGYPDYDIQDLILYVTSNKQITSDDRPVIPDGDVKPELGTQTIQGVLCFEDQWPKAGDYDLNDVAVRYKREFTFGTDNKYTGAKETFTFIQHDGAATFDNFFAYKLANLGTKTSASSDVLYETATSSYVINKSAKQSGNASFTVERAFSSSMDRKTIEDDFNPYIIIGSYTEGTRTEVHLPLKEGTAYMDQAKVATEDDAYFTNIKTKRPFAIDVADPKFVLSPEKVAIEVTYPKFIDWINSGSNRENSDWYKK